MKTIPFDIKFRRLTQSEENHYQGRYKVQTRSGKPVRIICWDRKDCKYPIIALVDNYSIEVLLSYRNDGRKCYSPESNDNLLLVDTWEPISEESKQTDLEKEIDKFLNETGAPYVWCNDDEQKEWCNIIARHFYELGRKGGK